ncbi:MAG: hypothetical protein AAFU41_00835 [Pseudomonadota bacterium]
MPIVTGTSDLIQDYLAETPNKPDPVQARGRAVYATGTITNAADDENTSMYHLIDIPSDAILLPDTFFDVTNDGFAQIVIGTKSDTDALVDQTKATGNIVTPVAQGGASHGLRLWQVLGMAENPGGNIALYKHAEANATAAGSTKFQIVYLYH